MINPKTIAEHVEDFLIWCEVDKNLSKRTVENYRLWLERFCNFAGNQKPFEIKLYDIRLYNLDLSRKINVNTKGNKKIKTISVKTRYLHLIALRAFLKYLQKNDINCISPEKIELPKIYDSKVNYLSHDEVIKFFANLKSDNIINKRNKAICYFLFSSGLRVSELCSLDRDCVNTKERSFSVIGKGGKRRLGFISKNASLVLNDYVNNRDDDMRPLFVSHSKRYKNNMDESHRRLSRVSVGHIVSEIGKEAGLVKHVTPHTLRHSFATNLLSNQMDIRMVQMLLGHTSIRTTQRYTHYSDNNLKKVYDEKMGVLC